MENNESFVAKWHRELNIFYRLKSMLILEGDILDQYQYPADRSIMPLSRYLYEFLRSAGYQTIVSYQSVRGFFDVDNEGNMLDGFKNITKASAEITDGCLMAPFTGEECETAPDLIMRALNQNESPTAVILDLASRYVAAPDSLLQPEVDSFTKLMIAAGNSREIRLQDGNFSKNLLICLVNKANDLPAWFCLNNPYVQILHLTPPESAERMDLLSGERFKSFFDRTIYENEIGYYQEHPEELKKLKEKFVGLTDGFSFIQLNEVRKLCRNEKCHIHQMTDMVDLYRYGIKENPWSRKELKDTLVDGMEILKKRVKGQDKALSRTMDVIKRSATGMSGLQHSSHTKPKGILFFAGPTGTGKTETAKTMAELIFGDEKRCIRFDMSEYAAANSDQRLLGAPPGYVGYQAGGQLTNAVRENPFSILLFDEIEKAHSSIFDKFLQILEDGRMTDGQGRTVYFSETIIIFTSNLGIYKKSETGTRRLNVSPEEPFEEVEKKVKDAIEHFFKVELGRPEILNRIGENIVVFDFIREESARAILRSQIDKIIANLREDKDIRLTVGEQAMTKLSDKAIGNLSNGGRGIGNVVETYLINPLARYVFDHNCGNGEELYIEDIDDSCVPANIIMREK